MSGARAIVPQGCEEREYARLLGYPWGQPLEGDVRERAVEAAEWYRAHGHPRSYVRELEAAAGERLAVAVVSAGPEVEQEIDRRWVDGRVDEAYFLDRYAAAIVERLARALGPHQSPGCGALPFEHQHTLFTHVASIASDIEMLPSGMLKPRHSLLALVKPGGGEDGIPCQRCDLEGCAFRRCAPSRRGAA